MAVNAPSTSIPAFPTVSQILVALQQYAQSRQGLLTNFNAGGPFETFLEAAAITLGSDASALPNVGQPGAYELLAQIRTAGYILSAQGVFLDLKAADVGIYRKGPTFASGFVIFTLAQAATSPFVIVAGTQVAAPTADPTLPPIVYTTQATVTVSTGQQASPAVAIVAVQSGSSGNQPAFAVNTVISSLGAISVSNAAKITGGFDTEDDDEPNGGLRARALAAIPNASQCTVSALANAAVNYQGITSATTLDLTDQDATIIVGGTPHNGDVLTATINGTAVPYTVGTFSDTTTVLIATHLAAAIVAAALSDVTASATSSTVTINSNHPLTLTTAVTGAGATTTLTGALNLIGIGTTVGRAIVFIDDGSGTVTLSAGASVAQLINDFNTGLYKAAGCIVKVVPAQLADMLCVVYIEVQASVINKGVTQASIQAAVQTAILSYGAGLLMGQPAKISDIIETARNIPGVSSVMVASGTDNLGHPFTAPTLAVPAPPTGSPISAATADVIPNANWVLRFNDITAITVNVAGTPTPYN